MTAKSLDLSFSEGEEGEEFSSRLYDTAGCDSSATDDDDDYDPQPFRKRLGQPLAVYKKKKIKQEETSAEDQDTAANKAVTDAGFVSQAPNTHSQITQSSSKPLPPGPHPQYGENLGYEGVVHPKMELLESCITGTTAQAEGCSSATETTAGTALL